MTTHSQPPAGDTAKVEFPVTSSCPCFGPDYAGACLCDDRERIIRVWASKTSAIPLMTDAQRAWCLDEIAGIEGYSRSDYETQPDSAIARGVLNAWRDYCRDKGIY